MATSVPLPFLILCKAESCYKGAEAAMWKPTKHSSNMSRALSIGWTEHPLIHQLLIHIARKQKMLWMRRPDLHNNSDLVKMKAHEPIRMICSKEIQFHTYPYKCCQLMPWQDQLHKVKRNCNLHWLTNATWRKRFLESLRRIQHKSKMVFRRLLGR